MIKKLFLGLTLLTIFTPQAARSTDLRQLICEANISFPNKAKVIYEIKGNVVLTHDGRIVSEDFYERYLFITIIRREANGQEKILRSEERLGNWFNDAPDADYRPLMNRFSPSFKSSIRDLYHVRSADNGIYIGMSDSKPTQIQIVHFLNKSLTKNLRSSVSNCSLTP